MAQVRLASRVSHRLNAPLDCCATQSSGLSRHVRPHTDARYRGDPTSILGGTPQRWIVDEPRIVVTDLWRVKRLLCRTLRDLGPVAEGEQALG